MQSSFLTYRSSRIHYLQGGYGNKLLLCFHGYGETAGSFAFLETALAAEFTLIAIDLPFHGSTEWREGLSFGPDDLLIILGELGCLKTSGDHPTKISLLGFSLGGRVALSLLEKIPDSIEKLVLLAPDGLKVNPWYWLATQNQPGNRVFRFTMKHPRWFLFILHAGRLFRLVNPSVYKFTANYIDNATVREELYMRWTALRNFRPSVSNIESLIAQRKIPVRFLFGQYDRIIRSGRGKKFQANTRPYCELFLLPSGHQLLLEKNLETICALLRG